MVCVCVCVCVDTASRKERSDFLTEIDMMKKISEGYCANIVNMVGCVTLQEPLCLITEFVSHGDLLDYLRNQRKKGEYFILLFFFIYYYFLFFYFFVLNFCVDCSNCMYIYIHIYFGRWKKIFSNYIELIKQFLYL